MSDDPRNIISTLAGGFVDARCLHVAARIGVADAVGDVPRKVVDVAAEVGVDPSSLWRLMRHLSALGVFEAVDGTLVHNTASRFLRSDHPDSQLDFIQLLALPVHWDAFGDLEHAIRTGRPGTEVRHPDGYFAYLAAHPEESLVYDAGMQDTTTNRVVPAYDFSRFAIIADIGGGRGLLLRAILDRTPAALGILFDQAHVVAHAEPHERMSVVSGDFFAGGLPQADCYVLSRVIHDWDDEEAVQILSAIRAAASADSRLLLLEYVVDADSGEFEATDVDIYMLALVTGRERTEAEFAALLAASGFELTRRVRTDYQSIFEARPI